MTKANTNLWWRVPQGMWMESVVGVEMTFFLSYFFSHIDGTMICLMECQ